jgi:CTP-dependent riboflavin kinase
MKLQKENRKELLKMNREELLQKMTHTLNNVNDEGLQLINYFVGGTENIEKYNINTTADRLAEIKQQEAEEKARKEEARRNKPSVYTLNNTMRLLGKQCVFYALDTYRGMFEEVMAAHPHEGTFDICIDMFSLGIICGKRIERKNRKERAARGGK